MKDLGTLGGLYSFANAVSNGQVVGQAYTAAGHAHAFSWTQAGGMKDLGTLGGPNSEAYTVSNGQVVGVADTASGTHHAFSIPFISFSIDPPSIIGGSFSPGAVTGTLTLTTPAPAGGAQISVQSHLDNWQILDVTAPCPVLFGSLAANKCPGSAGYIVVPEGQTSVTFPINTRAVNYPLLEDFRASYAGSEQTAQLFVNPSLIPPFGSQANARVAAILQQFVIGGEHYNSYSTAYADLLKLRNSSLEAEQDIYLAAAEHYLVTITYCLKSPSVFTPFKILGTTLFGIPIYEIFKIINLINAAGQFPPSSASGLSLVWGWRGASDAAKEIGYTTVPRNFPPIPSNPT